MTKKSTKCSTSPTSRYSFYLRACDSGNIFEETLVMSSKRPQRPVWCRRRGRRRGQKNIVSDMARHRCQVKASRTNYWAVSLAATHTHTNLSHSVRAQPAFSLEGYFFPPLYGQKHRKRKDFYPQTLTAAVWLTMMELPDRLQNQEALGFCCFVSFKRFQMQGENMNSD